jgi:pimeloyl-ACP methyl ester carboxylesterase
VVATGRHDVFVPPKLLGPAAQRHLGTRLHVMDDSGHLVLDESPGEVIALVARAMGSTWGDAA